MPRDIPSSVARVLDRVLAEDPDREALVTRGARLTYAQLDRQANQAAHALHDFGVRSGDRVAASLPNEADVVVAFHGAMRLGAVWVGVNRALAAPEKAFILQDCGASVLLCEDDQLVAGLPALKLQAWREAVAAADAGPVGVDVDPFAPAGLAYTSGTTGHPKGAVHSQWNLLVPGAVLVESRGYGPHLRKGDCFPFTILNMAVLTTLLVSQAGGCSVVMDRIDAEGVAEWIRTEHVTTWNGPPALLHSLATLDSVAPDDLASLEEVWTGGADCPEAIRSSFEAKFGLPVLATYGLSEAPTVVAIDDRAGHHVPGASGRPLPHLAVRIADADGTTLPAGETGEICVGPADDRYRLDARATGSAPRPPPRHSPAASCTRVTSGSSTVTATCTSATARACSSSGVAPTSTRRRWSESCSRRPGSSRALWSASPTSAWASAWWPWWRAKPSTRGHCATTAPPTSPPTRSRSASWWWRRSPGTPWARSFARSSPVCCERANGLI